MLSKYCIMSIYSHYSIIQYLTVIISHTIFHNIAEIFYINIILIHKLYFILQIMTKHCIKYNAKIYQIFNYFRLNIVPTLTNYSKLM